MKSGRQQFLDRAEAGGRIRKRAERRLDFLLHLQSPWRHRHDEVGIPTLEQLEETHRQLHDAGAAHDQGDLSV